jgi:hypothetical protein
MYTLALKGEAVEQNDVHAAKALEIPNEEDVPTDQLESSTPTPKEGKPSLPHVVHHGKEVDLACHNKNVPFANGGQDTAGPSDLTSLPPVDTPRSRGDLDVDQPSGTGIAGTYHAPVRHDLVGFTKPTDYPDYSILSAPPVPTAAEHQPWTLPDPPIPPEPSTDTFMATSMGYMDIGTTAGSEQPTFNAMSSTQADQYMMPSPYSTNDGGQYGAGYLDSTNPAYQAFEPMGAYFTGPNGHPVWYPADHGSMNVSGTRSTLDAGKVPIYFPDPASALITSQTFMRPCPYILPITFYQRLHVLPQPSPWRSTVSRRHQVAHSA